MTADASSAVLARQRRLRLWPFIGGAYALALIALVTWLAQSTPLLDSATFSAALAGQLASEQVRWLAVLCPFFCLAWLLTLGASWLQSLASFLSDRKLMRSLNR